MCRSMAGTGPARAVSDSHGSSGNPHHDEALCCLHGLQQTYTHAETKCAHAVWHEDTRTAFGQSTSSQGKGCMGSCEQSGPDRM